MKRRILCFVLTMAMVLSMLVVVPATIASADSYDVSISTAAEFKAFRDAVNAGTYDSGVTAQLTADIDISGENWTPIGNNTSHPFKGTFNGNGHTISGLIQTRGSTALSSSNAGLFGYVSSVDGGTTTITNFKLTSSGTGITGYGPNGNADVGTVVSQVRGSTTGIVTVNVTGVWSTVNLDASSAKAAGVGGIVGVIGWVSNALETRLYVDSCRYSGTLGSPSAGSNDYGGIVGWTRENNTPKSFYITNCLFDGVLSLYSSSPDDNGGIIGYLKGNSGSSKVIAHIENCIVAGQFQHPNKSGYAVTGYVLSECSGSNTDYQVTNVYYCNDSDRHTGGDLGGWYGYYKKGDGAISSLITATNVTAKTMTQLKALTSGFSDNSKWEFGTSSDLPVPKSIYDNFLGDPGIFDDMTQSEFTITSDEEMAEFAGLVNAGTTFAGKTIKLGADVTLTTTVGSTDASPFSGNFNGQGHTVTISQTLSNPDGAGGLFSFVRVPADSTLTIQNVHLAGTITLTNSSTGKGYVGALISCVDAGTSGSGGTLNVTNVWSTTRINAGTANTWYALSSYIGFVRHASGLKPITINIDSCLWDAVINAGPALEYTGAFVGHPGNQGNANRPLNLNITNSVAAGTIMLNTAYTDDTGLLVGYLKGNGTNSSTCVITANFHDLVIIGKFTSSVNVTKWCSLFQVSGTDVVDMNNFYYVNFSVPGKGDIPVYEGTATVTGEATVKTKAGIYELTSSAFSTPAKWSIASTHFPCPQGLVDTFGVPSSLAVSEYDLYDEFNIGTDEQMAAFAANVNSGKTYAGKTVYLSADVNLTTTIGATSSLAFSGNFNGQGHTVTITQSISDPDGNGGLFSFVRVPADSTLTIQNVHLAGTITLTNSSTGKGYCGALISTVDAGTTGSSGTLNVTNVWSTTRINAGASNTWYAVSAFIGFVRHASGLKPLTINMDSCLWDGVLNFGPATEYCGSFVGYTGNQSGANRPLTLNITNSVVAGTMMLNAASSDDTGLLTGYLKGNGTNSATSAVTANFHDIVVTGKITSSVDLTVSKWNASLFALSNTTTVDLANLYYIPRSVRNKTLTVYDGSSGTVTGTATEKTGIGMYSMTTSAFSNASKWNKTEGYFACPAGIVSTFGAVPDTLFVEEYDRYDTFSISTTAAFLAFRDAVNDGKNYSGKTVQLAADIDLAGESWREIGRASGTSSAGSNVFKGTFDGKGYTIFNMTTYLEPTSGFVDMQGGLFGNLGDGAIVKDFTLTGSMTIYNRSSSSGASSYFGSVANAVSGTVLIQGVHSSVDITTKNGKNPDTDAWAGGATYAAGLVGFILHNNNANLTIDGCEYSGTINCANTANGAAGIMSFDGNNNNSSTKVITISDTIFSGRMTINDNGGTYAYEKVGGIFGYLKTASLTISNTTSGGKVYFNRSKAWSATNISAGQIIGQVDSGASYTIDDSVAYTPIYLYTALPNSDETKFVLGEIGYLNGVYATNGEDNTDAIIGGMEAIAVAYDETDGTGIRFTASFFNKASCTGGGSSSANFGIFLMTKLVYDELGGEDASYSAVNALVGTGAVYKVYAAKYRNEGGAYTVNVIVMNLNEASEMAGELVAIPYAGDSLGNATVASYNELFAD